MSKDGHDLIRHLDNKNKLDVAIDQKQMTEYTVWPLAKQCPRGGLLP